ncbi:MAG: hypothetical protein Q4P21_15745 [Arthrobacter sp.]|nr:hypothetical protein [Arthrobacter sp.]MDO5754505.1 hypothetical protein [Arthrobacter sp.]
MRGLEGRAAKALKGSRDRVAAFEKVAAKRGEHPAGIALAWLNQIFPGPKTAPEDYAR